ncbi:MAG: integrase core domain-containing protein [Dehalococcoidia bacterium]|nr:integrase core domain-containing protein [Dehalococcoidia bacterium]
MILQGFLVNYNYFRPHMSLGNKTPAEAAGQDLPVKSWTDVVDMEEERDDS